MRPLLVAITLVLVSTAIAQDLLLAPKWKRDDLRTLYVTQSRSVPLVDEEGSPRDSLITYNTSAKVKVYDLTPEKALIAVDHENVVLPLVRHYFSGGLPSEMDPYKRMIIRYEVDRTTGASHLMNAEDLRQFTERAVDISLRALRKKDANATAIVEQELAPVVAQFNDPALVEQFFDHRFGFLTIAFGVPLTLGETFTIEETQADPFGAPGDSVVVAKSITLQNNSSEEAIVKVVHSLGAKAQAVSGRGAVRAHTANDAVSVKSWQKEQLITLDVKSTWPIRMTMNTTVAFSNGNNMGEQISIEVR